MSAHKRRIVVVLCSEEGCSRVPLFTVHTGVGEEVGRFCGRHADKRVAAMNAHPRPLVEVLAGMPSSPGWSRQPKGKT